MTIIELITEFNQPRSMMEIYGDISFKKNFLINLIN